MTRSCPWWAWMNTPCSGSRRPGSRCQRHQATPSAMTMHTSVTAPPPSACSPSRCVAYAPSMCASIKRPWTGPPRSSLCGRRSIRTRTVSGWAVITSIRIDVARSMKPSPKHGSWLNLAEIELSVLTMQCLDRRMPDLETLTKETQQWEPRHNATQFRCSADVLAPLGLRLRTTTRLKCPGNTACHSPHQT
jgi:hypothetical protein